MKVKVNLKHCYGITHLDHEFDFSEKNVLSVYASNGVMKTSLAKTFKDLSEKAKSRDEVYPDMTSSREISNENGQLKSEEVFVVEPYSSEYHSDNVARLLVNDNLKRKYDNAYKQIKIKEEQFLAKIKDISGHKELNDIEQEVSKVFHQGEENKFFESLNRIKDEVSKEDVLYGDINYIKIFNEKSSQLFEDSNFKKNVQEYVTRYNELLDNSNFFRKGIFNHTQASDVAKQLEKSGFFNAQHSVNLRNKKDELTSIPNQVELEKVIEEEKNKILADDSLRKLFAKVDDAFKRNADRRSFRDYLSENYQVVSELANPEGFKGKLWKGYFKKNEEDFHGLLDTYNQMKATIEDIKTQAEKEKDDWDRVIEDFNNRFFVPFKLHVKNKVDTMLNGASPITGFKFGDVDIEENTLKRILSQGEKRALYILNILFEIETRKKLDGISLLIIDDIADSFDYKNKYAIIEYLSDISKQENFYLLILTHNFDFHRSVSGRLNLPRDNILSAYRDQGKIKILVDKYRNNPLNQWRKHLDNLNMLLASIPMVRNLLEYSGKSEECKAMTSFLHMKKGNENLTVRQLKCFYGDIFGETAVEKIEKIENLDDGYFGVLHSCCDDILNSKEIMQLEEKIILSIAIRLYAEKFLINKINDEKFVDGLTSNQTAKLFGRYKEKFPNDSNIKLLERVNLMTPENIHLNSFMYEPILDMGGEELTQLYQQIKKIQPNE